MIPGEEDKVGIFLVSIKEEEEEEKTVRKEKDGLMSHKIGSIKISLYIMHLKYPAQQDMLMSV